MGKEQTVYVDRGKFEMSEGITCYERDEALCEDGMCLRTGCRLRNKRLEEERKIVKSDKPKIPTWSADYIRDLSERVYRASLEHPSGGGAGAVSRMLKKDGDGGVKLRNRAAAYDKLSRTYLEILGFKPPIE